MKWMAKPFVIDETKIPANADSKVIATSGVLEKSRDNDGSCDRHDLEGQEIIYGLFRHKDLAGSS